MACQYPQCEHISMLMVKYTAGTVQPHRAAKQAVDSFSCSRSLSTEATVYQVFVLKSSCSPFGERGNDSQSQKTSIIKLLNID